MKVMSIKYDKHIRTIKEGKYNDFKQQFPELCKLLGYNQYACMFNIETKNIICYN